MTGARRHLLGAADLSADEIEGLLTLTDSFVEVSRRRMPKVPALQGRTVTSLFYEDSTRTRLSFEQAAKRLSADTLSFSVSTSSVAKGESLRDTVETIEAMGVDAIVVRHRSAGVPHQIARWVSGSVVNAGDGWHEHPTQALLDCYTIREHLGGLDGRHIAIVGDINHSRVARSDVLAFTKLGAEVTRAAAAWLKERPRLLPYRTAVADGAAQTGAPLLRPLACRPSAGSFSSRATEASGNLRRSSRAMLSPITPPPITR